MNTFKDFLGEVSEKGLMGVSAPIVVKRFYKKKN